MKAGTQNRKYKYIPPEDRIGKKAIQRIKRNTLHKAIRSVSPFYAFVEDEFGKYL